MNIPADFLQQMHQLVGEEQCNQLLCALDTESPTSIRMNFVKGIHSVNTAFVDAEVPWCKGGIYLKHRPNFTFDPLFHAGAYYVQEASSMFMDEIVRQLVTTPVTMLDLCAAPGGKSTTVRAALPTGSLLFCNEPIPTRAHILAENMSKFGHPDVIVTQNLPADYRKTGLQFDVVLCDVPCSGEGMFRKDKASISEWNLRNVDKCRILQREIVQDAWSCLRPGGLLIYSTCTFNAEENERNIAWMLSELQASLVEVKIQKEWGITDSFLPEIVKNIYRFIPGHTKGEGLCVAVMRKICERDSNPPTKPPKKKNIKADSGQDRLPINGLTTWLQSPESFVFRQTGDILTAIPKTWSDIFDTAVSSRLKVLQAGIGMAKIKGTNLIPETSLALSACFNTESFPCVEINDKQAIAYLRKEAMVLPPEIPCGYVVMTYKGVPLGFVKNIGQRANNLYPQEWRIKSTHIPDNTETTIIQ